MQHRLAPMDSVTKRSYLGKVALYSRKLQLSHEFLLCARNLKFYVLIHPKLIEIRVIFAEPTAITHKIASRFYHAILFAKERVPKRERVPQKPVQD